MTGFSRFYTYSHTQIDSAPPHFTRFRVSPKHVYLTDLHHPSYISLIFTPL